MCSLLRSRFAVIHDSSICVFSTRELFHPFGGDFNIFNRPDNDWATNLFVGKYCRIFLSQDFREFFRNDETRSRPTRRTQCSRRTLGQLLWPVMSDAVKKCPISFRIVSLRILRISRRRKRRPRFYNRNVILSEPRIGIIEEFGSR